MQVISTIETYVVDSLQYLQGLMPSYDLLACMREQRDRFLTRLLVDLYLVHAQNLLRDGAHVRSFILVRAHACCIAGYHYKTQMVAICYV